jgi:hypothetical protein
MITTWNEFFDLVCRTREAQKEYFAKKTDFALTMARRKERELDACIEYQKRKRAGTQRELKL